MAPILWLCEPLSSIHGCLETKYHREPNETDFAVIVCACLRKFTQQTSKYTWCTVGRQSVQIVGGVMHSLTRGLAELSVLLGTPYYSCSYHHWPAVTMHVSLFATLFYTFHVWCAFTCYRKYAMAAWCSASRVMSSVNVDYCVCSKDDNASLSQFVNCKWT